MTTSSTAHRRLSAHDTVFLHWERPEQPMHVGEALVYAGHLSARELAKKIEARMALLPRYRQKVVFPPFGIAHPTWEDDPDFDVRDHVDERWLPAGSGDAELSKVLGELFCELLDRDRPLWQVTVVHGHQSGNTVVFLKLHHSMVDGVSSVELIQVLHSPAPGTTPVSGPEQRRTAGRVELLRAALADNLDKGLDVAGNAVGLLRPGRVTELLQRSSVLLRTLADAVPMLVVPPPSTPFNAPIHAKREIAWLHLPIDDVHGVRKQLGATVNDLVLTLLSGALRRYMERTGHQTDGVALRSMVPWSVRTPSQSGTFGNAVSMVVAPLLVGESDPQKRLRAQQRAMQRLKDRQQAAGIHEMIAATEWLPAPLYAAIWRLWPKGYFPFNIVSSNVHGPRTPLFLDELEMLAWYPVGVNWTTNGLFLVTISYREHLTLGIAVDPEIVPDVWQVVEDLRAEYDELKKSVEDD
jgi:diacylglycerol O-acyltransferase